MFINRKKSTKHRQAKVKCVRILYFLIPVFFITGAFFITRITFSANGVSFPKKPSIRLINLAPTPEPKNNLPSNVPPQTPASRIKITIGETSDFPIAEAASSAMIILPEIAAAEIKNGNVLTITGLKIGETILIISSGGKRQIFVVQIAGKPLVSERRNFFTDRSALGENDKMSGSFDVLYAQGFDGTPSLLSNRLEFRRKISKDRMLRFDGEMYKFFGGNRQPEFGSFQNYGLDRISVGIDSPDKTIDFLDSQVRLSPVGFNNFEMRGFHLTSTTKPLNNLDSPRKGVEIFAGLTRPTYALYDKNRAKFAGAMLPVASGDSWQLRAGFVSVFAPKNNQSARGGTVLRLDGSYAASEKFSADGEIGYGNGGLSWNARLNLKLKQFGAFAEIGQTDKNSPLGSLYSQTGGRQTEAFSAYWRPENRFNFSANYNHTKFERFTNSQFADFNRSTFSANASYRPNQNLRLNFRFIDRKIETAAPASSAKFQIAARTFAAGYNIRFNRYLANDFEAGINFSREANAASKLETGFNLREQLRASWNRNSITGFFNYARKTPSLTGLIIRNPQLLPLELQPIFALNPARFLQVYRDRLAFLLPGIELPQTRSLEAGFRFQKTLSRFTLNGETRYTAGEIFAQNQKNLFTSIGVNFRLDAANSVQINGWRSFGAMNNQTAIIFGFTHRFGRESGGGFQFSKLLGLNKGKVSGRVYDDLNGNGQDDAGEPGIVGQTIQLNEKRSVKTDADGRYQFSASEGAYNIRLVSEDLGVRLRASTATERQISLSSSRTVNVSFGVSTFGFLGGRVFNDLGLTDETPKYNSQGVDGVRLVLRSLDAQSKNLVVEKTSGGGGNYEFRNLRPGNYLLAVDLATLPANFRVPAKTSWEIKVAPLAGFYLDIPIAAQRAVAGVVFVDKDGDGNYNPQIDEAVAGASIFAGDASGISDQSGAYIVRNLSAGKIKITVRSPFETENTPIFLELGAEPTTKRAFNLAVRRQFL